jgi:hypothetical protein
VWQEVKMQMERLEEENSSLRAISKYLMQERKELVRKAESAAKRNQNLKSLMNVMRWRLGLPLPLEHLDAHGRAPEDEGEGALDLLVPEEAVGALHMDAEGAHAGWLGGGGEVGCGGGDALDLL